MNHSDKATALYTRVSTYDVNKKHLDNQMQQLFHYLQEHGIDGYLLYEDNGYIWQDWNRPGLTKLYKDMYGGKIDALVVSSSSRITKDYNAYQLFLKDAALCGVTVISLDEKDKDEDIPLAFSLIGGADDE